MGGEEVAPVEWVFLGTKAHQSAEAGGWLLQLCGPETRAVVVAQVEQFCWKQAALCN